MAKLGGSPARKTPLRRSTRASSVATDESVVPRVTRRGTTPSKEVSTPSKKRQSLRSKSFKADLNSAYIEEEEPADQANNNEKEAEEANGVADEKKASPVKLQETPKTGGVTPKKTPKYNIREDVTPTKIRSPLKRTSELMRDRLSETATSPVAKSAHRLTDSFTPEAMQIVTPTEKSPHVSNGSLDPVPMEIDDSVAEAPINDTPKQSPSKTPNESSPRTIEPEANTVLVSTAMKTPSPGATNIETPKKKRVLNLDETDPQSGANDGGENGGGSLNSSHESPVKEPLETIEEDKEESMQESVVDSVSSKKKTPSKSPSSIKEPPRPAPKVRIDAVETPKSKQEEKHVDTPYPRKDGKRYFSFFFSSLFRAEKHFTEILISLLQRN